MVCNICEGLWLKRILGELRVPFEKTMVLHCDNKAVIQSVKNPVHHDRTKHVEIDRHFMKEKIENGTIDIVHVPTILQTIDILTKALSRS